MKEGIISLARTLFTLYAKSAKINSKAYSTYVHFNIEDQIRRRSHNQPNARAI
jgi:hypothetical protein